MSWKKIPLNTIFGFLVFFFLTLSTHLFCKVFNPYITWLNTVSRCRQYYYIWIFMDGCTVLFLAAQRIKRAALRQFKGTVRDSKVYLFLFCHSLQSQNSCTLTCFSPGNEISLCLRAWFSLRKTAALWHEKTIRGSVIWSAHPTLYCLSYGYKQKVNEKQKHKRQRKERKIHKAGTDWLKILLFVFLCSDPDLNNILANLKSFCCSWQHVGWINGSLSLSFISISFPNYFFLSVCLISY